MMKGINLHTYPSTFKHSSRIFKETKSLADSKLFEKIYIGAILGDELSERENIDDQREVWRVPLRLTRMPDGSLLKVFKIIEWCFKLFFRFKKEGVEVAHCHGLSSLPIGILLKWFSGSKVVYDAHELETEREGMSQLRRKLSKIAEKFFIRWIDSIVVVSN
jgi:hypothetical protein